MIFSSIKNSIDEDLVKQYKNVLKAKDFEFLKIEKERYTDAETGAHFEFNDLC